MIGFYISDSESLILILKVGFTTTGYNSLNMQYVSFLFAC